MYKVLSKVLTNILRKVIGSVISDSESAFIQGGQILDEILVANDIVDDARKLKKELLLFKVDFEKTFDSVYWKYFKTVMVKLNFPILSRKWIIECVSTTSASILVNGCPTNEFKFERGLRQGDPLSQFLFLVAVEEINVLLKASMEARFFTRYSVGH